MVERRRWIFNLSLAILYYCLCQKCNAQDSEFYPQFHLVTRMAVPKLTTTALNTPDLTVSNPEDKFSLLESYTTVVQFFTISEPDNEQERMELLHASEKKLLAFIDRHMQDLWALLIQLDRALNAMVQFKTTKKMTHAENKIRASNAHVPFGVYASPEYKCLETSYYISSSQSVEDTQMILESEKKPHCLTFKGSFVFGGHYHKTSEKTYIGPHAENFNTQDTVQGLYCEYDIFDEMACVYKIAPREEFPESVEYQPKVSFFCGPYRYFLPPTTDIRCVFSMSTMSFTLQWGFDGVQYKHSELSFSYPNGQVFYTDEPMSGLSCWSYACKWRHNQAQRINRFTRT